MDRPYIDLHVHSFYSDGSLSPEEIVADAIANSVGTLAIADHDVLEGGIIAKKLCLDSNIRYIPAVEIDTLDGDNNIHILAYGIDIEDPPLNDFINHTRFLLDESSLKLIEFMHSDYPEITLDDYMRYMYDRRQGGWKALHYLLNKGLTRSLKEGIQFYGKYGLTYDKSGYSTIAATACRIKAASGYSVLAHPGEVIDSTDINRFTDELRRITAFGLDGIECYYPTHSEAVTNVCLGICKQYGLMITSGSDCHGVFGKTRVGEMDITIDKLELNELLIRSY